MDKENIEVMSDEELLIIYSERDKYTSEEREMLRFEIDYRGLIPVQSVSISGGSPHENKDDYIDSESYDKEAKRCSQCGYENRSDANYCKVCRCDLNTIPNRNEGRWKKIIKIILIILLVLVIVFVVLPIVGILLLAGTCMALIGAGGH